MGIWCSSVIMSLSGQIRKMRIGIFGGTFDPPHVGHLILAAEACSQLALDKIYWLLTPVSPFKQDQRISPLEARIEMVLAAIEGNSKFYLSRIDIDRPPPHYAADSLELFHAQFPDHSRTYIMGMDSLRSLPTWHEPRRLLSLCASIGVLRRPGTEVNLQAIIHQLPALETMLEWVTAPLVDISASHIRFLARAGGAYRYYVPPAVYEIIRRRQLYLDAIKD